MKKQTNLYAQQMTTQKRQAGVHLKPCSKFSLLKDVTVEEMTSFLAIIHMGIVKKPQTVDYWSINPVLQTVFTSKTRKCERFRTILSFFIWTTMRRMCPTILQAMIHYTKCGHFLIIWSMQVSEFLAHMCSQLYFQISCVWAKVVCVSHFKNFITSFLQETVNWTVLCAFYALRCATSFPPSDTRTQDHSSHMM